MDLQVSPEELIDAFRTHWPREYEITSLRLMTGLQAERIRKLLSEPDGSPAED